jgi:3-(3-hydroxy-phenyl)propionate hydroxylase
MPGLAAGVIAEDTARAGELPAQPELDGVLLDDRCGPRFAILGREDPRRAITESSIGFWDSLPAAFVADPDLAPWLAEMGGEYVVLRPDRYVYGIANHQAELDTLTDRLRAEFASVGCTR